MDKILEVLKEKYEVKEDLFYDEKVYIIDTKKPAIENLGLYLCYATDRNMIIVHNFRWVVYQNMELNKDDAFAIAEIIIYDLENMFDDVYVYYGDEDLAIKITETDVLDKIELMCEAIYYTIGYIRCYDYLTKNYKETNNG